MDAVDLKNKIIVSVAPVGQSEESFAASPKSSAEVAAEVVACVKNGASVVHHHPRGEDGMPAGNLASFARTFDLVKAEVDVVVQGSTGGLSTMTLDERCIALNDPRVETASLNIGSINFGETVYVNTLPDARYWAKRMLDASVKAEMEIFDLGMLNAAAALIQEGLMTAPPLYGIALGFEWGLPGEKEMLDFVVSRLPEGALWGILHHGMKNLDLLSHAAQLGACFVRVGYEDSLLGPGGATGLTNAQLVAAASEAVAKAGRIPASADEARVILGI